MAEKSMLGGALAEVVGPLKDLAEKLGGEGGEQWFAALKRFLRKEEPWPKFPVWKTIKLDAGFKTADDFRSALKKAKCRINDRADEIMNKLVFAESLAGVDPEEKYDLVLLTAAQLTGKSGGTTAEVFAGAGRLGLEKCPAWIGPKLCLGHLDLLNDEWIFVGMEPITVSDGDPGVFRVVRRRDPELWLVGDWGGPGIVWLPSDLWVFRLPRK
jgi:hypothetical protein